MPIFQAGGPLSIGPITTRSAKIYLREDGITEVKIQFKIKQTMQDAKENLAAAILVGLEKPRPLLVDIREAEPLDPEIRHYYSGKALEDSFLALALVVDASPFGKMMGNIYFSVAKPGIPIRLFTDFAKSHLWLNEFIER